jgi:hypothetical protein
VRLEIYDLAGRLVHTQVEERGIGPARLVWDGALPGGGLAPPGLYLWLLRVQADAFEERHRGSLGVAY